VADGIVFDEVAARGRDLDRRGGAASFSVVVSVIGTAERTSASSDIELKLAAEMVRWYGLSGRLVNW
jgi:hypothetical protein